MLPQDERFSLWSWLAPVCQPDSTRREVLRQTATQCGVQEHGQAEKGCTVDIPTLNGYSKVRVPPNAKSGGRLKLRGKGIPHDEGAGDIVATLKVTPRQVEAPGETFFRHMPTDRK